MTFDLQDALQRATLAGREIAGGMVRFAADVKDETLVALNLEAMMVDQVRQVGQIALDQGATLDQAEAVATAFCEAIGAAFRRRQ